MDLEKMRERVAALESYTLELPSELAEMAQLAAREEAALAKRDEAFEREVKRLCDLRTVEARESLSVDQRDKAIVRGICDAATHRATATDTSSEEKILETGKGIFVVTRLSRKDQQAAVKALGRSGGKHTTIMEDDPEGIATALAGDKKTGMGGCCLYPTDKDEVRRLCHAETGLAAGAYRLAAGISGVWASETSGK